MYIFYDTFTVKTSANPGHLHVGAKGNHLHQREIRWLLIVILGKSLFDTSGNCAGYSKIKDMVLICFTFFKNAD